MPIGGTFSGTGIIGNSFYPDIAGIGTHSILYTFQDSLGCTLIDSITIDVQGTSVTINSFTDTVCVYDSLLAITDVTPTGGQFSGVGVTNNVFSPSLAGIGQHFVYYTYTDNNNCSSTDSIEVIVDGCATLQDLNHSYIKIYPNPVTSKVYIEVDNHLSGKIEVELISTIGDVILREQCVMNKIVLDVSRLSSGVYNLKITSTKNQEAYHEKLIIE